MQDASYFRSQADLYLMLACQMSDPHAAKSFRESAADYLAKAIALEGLNPSSPQPPRASSVLSPPDK